MGTVTFDRIIVNSVGISASLPIPDITITGSTFSIPAITATMTNWAYNASQYPDKAYHTATYFQGYYMIDNKRVYSSGGPSISVSNTSALQLPRSSDYTSSNWTTTVPAVTATTSDYFNANNPTTRAVEIDFLETYWKIDARDGLNHEWSTPLRARGYSTVTLNAPPYYSTEPTISKNTDEYYKNITIVTVSSSAIAQFGGSIKSTKLTIGAQTTSIDGNGTLSILLNKTGTFTPQLFITDSRNQQTIYNFPSITVENGDPTVCKTTYPTSNKDGFWTDKSIASITLSEFSVPYGGTATATFTIGNQSVSRTNNGVLSIVPTTVGAFTPTLSIVDSFGRTYSKVFDPITINQYTVPNIRFQPYRAKNVTEGGVTKYGIKDEESTTYILIDSEISYINQTGNLTAPTIKIDDVTTANVTWYETYSDINGLSDPVNWTNYNPTSPIKLYGLITGSFSQTDSYSVGIIAHDSVGGDSIEIKQSLLQAFFTIDFLAGGHGVSLGQMASQEGFYCAMDSHFKDYSGIMRGMFNLFHPKGSYYETNLPNAIPSGHSTPTEADLEALGDTWFNPNYAWGGTWILETAGQVHVSAGTGYSVNGATTNQSDGGSTTSATSNHTLGTSEIPAHTHGQRDISGYLDIKPNIFYSTGGASSWSYPGTTSGNAQVSGSGNVVRLTYNATHTHDSVGSGGAHNHGSVSTMQPYINVYRWHRTD